jgi:dCMP deaminase
MAQKMAEASKDPSTKCGAIIIDRQGRIVNGGYNGFPQDMEDKDKFYNDREEKYARIIHAEMNAVILAGRQIPKGSTLYTWPFLSCHRCAVHCIQAGVRRFVAPKPSKEILSRWSDSLKRSRRYIRSMRARVVEIT